jgi:ABC-type multidrug transport system ATPase subunit
MALQLVAENIGKKFGRNWIFRNLQFTINSAQPHAILGRNGSGKSTLLKIIGGFGTPTEGSITYQPAYEEIDMAMISPDLELIEEFTFKEFIEFHSTFKVPKESLGAMAEQAQIPLTRPLKDFSTGMKQRVKLCTAFYFENDMILLDEPTSNLDNQGIEWFMKEIEKQMSRLVIIATNQKIEADVCSKKIEL